MRSWGTTYHVAPVIHTPGICREHNGLFVNFDFTRKVTMQYCLKAVKILVNGKEEQLFIPGSTTMYGGKGSGGAENGPKALPYWIYGKYGFSEGVRITTGAEVSIIPVYKIPEIDSEKYIIISSGEKQHAKFIKYALIINKESLPSYAKTLWTDVEHYLLVMCAAFFRAAHFYSGKQLGKRGSGKPLTPLFTRLDADSEEYDLHNLNLAETWREILGRSLLGTRPTDVDILRSMNTHFSECERYLNDQFRGELVATEDDIDPNINTYEFLFYIIKVMTRSRIRKAEDLSSLYGKRLTVVDYLLLGKGGFTSTVSSLRWALEGLDKNNPIEVTGKLINDQLNRNLVSNVVVCAEKHNASIMTFNASSESLVLAVSTHAISQTETDKKTKKSKKTVNLTDKTKHASASHMDAGNMYFIPKSSPFRYGILGLRMKTSKNLVIQRNPKLETKIKAVEEDIVLIGN